ncbi:MAG: hypothetical protein K9H41_09640, partial [Bacteroidia bacterium]|nr:hypothetical protein [Bacteroidia bacterium]
MKNIYLLFIILLFSTKAFAQPANNECTTATNMGSLPTPGACVAGLQNGAVVSFTGTNVGATPSLQGNGNSYQSILDCEGVFLNDQAGPALDVWYSFVPTGNIVNINISGYGNANFGVWTGACNNLQPVGCSTDGSIVLEQMNTGQTYYIQVSGNTATSTDANFTVNVDNDIDCNDCFRNGTLVVNPLPINGQYAPGTLVNFCFHIDQFQQANVNWLHGVQFNFGAGWNLSTLVPAAVTAAAPTTGSWAYYPGGCTSTATGNFFGAGFYFNRSIQDILGGEGPVNANPGNNFGDALGNTTNSPYNVSNSIWNFCVTIRTSTLCSPGSDLSLTINTSGDGESGGWTDAGCIGDPPTTFVAYSACCPPTVAGTSITCNGGATGSATATPVGVSGPYTYVWSGPGGFTSTTTAVAGANSVSGLTAGIYTVTVLDLNFCSSTSTINITQPAVLPVTASSTNSIICLGGSTTLNGGGASTYVWTGGVTNGVAFSPTSTASYTVIGTSAAGCTNTAVKSITVNPTPTITVNSNAPFCAGGTLSLTASGASTYTWSGSALTTTTGSAVTTANPATGTYSVTGTSTLGCQSSNTISVVINPKPAATLSFTNPTCGLNNGIITIIPANTVPISTITSTSGTVTGQTITGLGAGSPTITLTSNLGCTFTVSATLTMTPGPSSIAITPTNATCGNNNGSFTFSGSGGTPAYTYAINNGAFSATSPTTGLAPGTYSVTVKDANGCLLTQTTSIVAISTPTAISGNSSPASCAGATGSYTVTGVSGGVATYSYSIDNGALSTSTVITNLSQGTHSITVQDANGCTFATTFSVGVVAGITSATVIPSTASCGVANATATVTTILGGVPSYSFSFDNGAFSGSSSVTGLAAGNHTVIIRDANACTLTVPFTVTSLGSPTTSIASFSNVTCFGLSNGSCTVAIPTGGAGAPFTYTLTSPFQSNGIGVFNGLPAGTYNISVEDAANCIATTSVIIGQPAALTVSATATPVLCNGGATGSINLTGSGGTTTYSYNLNGGAYQASSTFSNQVAGIYTMGIKDVNGCLATQTVQITQPTALAIAVSSQSANCTAANGIASATVS